MIKRLKNARIIFHDKELYNTYKKLENGTSDEKKLYKWISRAIEDLKEDGFSGMAIPKDRIPKKYQKEFKTKSLWKYDLPKAYRIIYTVQNNEVEVFAILLEWFDHKTYAKLFKYKVKWEWEADYFYGERWKGCFSFGNRTFSSTSSCIVTIVINSTFYWFLSVED